MPVTQPVQALEGPGPWTPGLEEELLCGTVHIASPGYPSQHSQQKSHPLPRLGGQTTVQGEYDPGETSRQQYSVCPCRILQLPHREEPTIQPRRAT
jgi:hypothetical protein